MPAKFLGLFLKSHKFNACSFKEVRDLAFLAFLGRLCLNLAVPQDYLDSFVLKVEAHHIGDMKFKGVHGLHTMMQINDSRYGDRQFPKTPPSSKAEIVSTFLLYI